MSHKKKEQRKDEKLQRICEAEPPMPKYFTKPFKAENGAWYCGNESCKVENAELFDLGDGWHACGHCYRKFNL